MGRASSTGGLTASGLEPGGGTFGGRSKGYKVIIYTAGSKSVTMASLRTVSVPGIRLETFRKFTAETSEHVKVQRARDTA